MRLLMKRARILTTGLRLESWESWKVAGTEDTYTCEASNRFGTPVGQDEVETAKFFVRDWEVILMVKYINSDGQEAIDEQPLVFRGIRLNEPTDFLKEQRDQLASEVAGIVLDRGWVARSLN